MSPTRSITATSSRVRTVVPVASLVVMAASCSWLIGVGSEPHLQLQHVLVVVAGLPGVVDHVLDQEETPSAGTLQAGELGLEVRLLRRTPRGRPALVDDLHPDPVGVVSTRMVTGWSAR